MTVGDIAADIERKAAGHHVLLLLDFDGTLCGFQSDPDAVGLEPAVRRALDDLAGSKSLTLGYISGRAVTDLRRRVPVGPTTYLAGLHGLEIEGPNGRHRADAGLVAVALAIREIAVELHREVAAWPGVRIEDKGPAVALHTRDACPDVRARAEGGLLRLTAAHSAAPGLALLKGDCVLELLPAARWHKGDALRWIRHHAEAARGPCFTIVVGDDTTDEDAFRAIGRDGVAIAASARPAGADVRLAGPPAVAQLLLLLAASCPGDLPGVP